MASLFLFSTSAIFLMVLTLPTHAQITTPCTPSMISTFSPCINFVTNSSVNGTSPSPDCCNSLKSLMTNGKDCFCLIRTGSLPFNIPINRTLAISLPRACNMPDVPLQCKSSGAPVPAPVPTAFGPTVSPKSAPFPTSKAPADSEPLSPTLSPEADATPTPPSPTTESGAPTGNTGNRAGDTPSAAQPSLSVSPLLLLAMLGVIALKYY